MTTFTLPQQFPIRAIHVENRTSKTFILDGALQAKPGQFVMAWLPRVDEKPFSLAAADPISLTIAAVGPFSRAIHQLNVGDSLWVRGPLGQPFTLPANAPGAHLLLAGGGYGAAPLLFLARQAIGAGFRVSVVLGARSAAQLLLTEPLRRAGVTLYLTTEDGSAGQTGIITVAISPLLTKHPPHTVYACGPGGMLTAIHQICWPRQIPTQLSWEAHMRCGIGLCGSCELDDGWLTCLDGPVQQL